MRLNAQRAQEIMNLKGITRSEIERKTGVTARSIEWILQNGFVSDDALDRIASALDVEPSEIYRPDTNAAEENEIEFIKNNDLATVTFSQMRFINKIKRLAEEYPDEVKIIADNKNADGNTYCLCASLPVSWIVKPGKPAEMNLTDEQREERRKQLLQNTNSHRAEQGKNQSESD